MLPNTVAAVATLLGLSALKRVPAMVNYSSGPDAVRSSIAAAGIRTIVTSRRFIETARSRNPLDPSVPLGPLVQVLVAPGG